MVVKHTLQPLVEEMQTLIGKTLSSISLKEQLLEISTTDGFLFKGDFSKWFTFFRVELSRLPLVQGEVIQDIILTRSNKIYIETDNEYAYVEIEWLNEDTVFFQEHENGNELLLGFETSEEEEIIFLYFKHEGEWRMSSFFRETLESRFTEIAEQYDFLNHPKIRLKFITQ